MKIQAVSRSKEQAYSLFGVQLHFLIPPIDGNDRIAMYRGVVPPAVLIPLHSHREPELFYVLDGSIEIYRDTDSPHGWTTLQQDEVFSVAGGVKHALRNSFDKPCTIVLIANGTLYDFFRRVVVPGVPNEPQLPLTAGQMQEFVGAAARYDYWMASPEENSAIGLHLPPMPQVEINRVGF
ncbi:MAG: cupin domain-containing protein [Janthinobacterium lividum]